MKLSGALMLQYHEIVSLKLIKICVLNWLRLLLPKTVDTIDVPCYYVCYHHQFFFFVVFSNPVLLVLEHINSLSYLFLMLLVSK